MNAAVRLSSVTKTFGTHTAVRDLSLEVPKGSIYGFIGPNGSGKTTTIRMILHILHADSGEVEVLGERGTRAANDRVGYLPEERGLYKKMTVRRLLAYYASLEGHAALRGRADARCDRWLERLELAEWRDAKVEALSKGMSAEDPVHRDGHLEAGPDHPRRTVLRASTQSITEVLAQRRSSTCT